VVGVNDVVVIPQRWQNTEKAKIQPTDLFTRGSRTNLMVCLGCRSLDAFIDR
jgi:hypothetical protein